MGWIQWDRVEFGRSQCLVMVRVSRCRVDCLRLCLSAVLGCWTAWLILLTSRSFLWMESCLNRSSTRVNPRQHSTSPSRHLPSPRYRSHAMHLPHRDGQGHRQAGFSSSSLSKAVNSTQITVEGPAKFWRKNSWAGVQTANLWITSRTLSPFLHGTLVS